MAAVEIVADLGFITRLERILNMPRKSRRNKNRVKYEWIKNGRGQYLQKGQLIRSFEGDENLRVIRVSDGGALVQKSEAQESKSFWISAKSEVQIRMKIK